MEDFAEHHPYKHILDSLKNTEAYIHKVEVLKPKRSPAGEAIVVSSEQYLADLVRNLMVEKELGICIKYNSENIIYILGISTIENTYLIDCLVLRNSLHLLQDVFVNPDIIKIVYQNKGLQHLQLGHKLYMVNMFDTRIAMRRLGIGRQGLLNYIRRKFKAKIKDIGKEKWSHYCHPWPMCVKLRAIYETHYLIPVFRVLRNELGIYTKDILEECNDLCRIVYPPRVYPPGVYPPRVYPPRGYPPGVYPPRAYPPRVYPPRVYPPRVYPPRVYPPRVYPPRIGFLDTKRENWVRNEQRKLAMNRASRFSRTSINKDNTSTNPRRATTYVFSASQEGDKNWQNQITNVDRISDFCEHTANNNLLYINPVDVKLNDFSTSSCKLPGQIPENLPTSSSNVNPHDMSSKSPKKCKHFGKALWQYLRKKNFGNFSASSNDTSSTQNPEDLHIVDLLDLDSSPF